MRKLGFVMIVAIGLFAIIAALQLFVGTVSLAGMIGEPGFPGRRYVVLMLLPALAMLAMGLVLIWRRQTLAEWWFDDSDSNIAVGPVELLRVALIVTGVAVTIFGVPAFIRHLVNAFPGGGVQFLDVAVVAARVAFGVLLVVYSAPLAQWLWSGKRRSRAEVAPDKVQHRCPSCNAPFNPADYRAGIPPQCSECGGPLDLDRA